MPDLHPEQDYFRHLEEGRFMIQRSRDTGRCFFFPRVAEPVTGSTNLEWIQPSGRGTVHSVTIVRTRDPAKDYNVVLVDLAEGPRMMARVDGIPNEQVKIGMAVQAKIIRENDRAMVVFEPAGQAKGGQ